MPKPPSQDPGPPPEIGPHDGRELELMLAGAKPLAMFIEGPGESGLVPDADFAGAVANGRIVRRERRFIYKTPDGEELPARVVFYALPGKEARIDAAEAIVGPALKGETKPTTEHDIALGRLLGYSEDQIAVFLERRKRTHGGRDA